MSTLNGCGTKFLGEYDNYEDGSYITIEYVVLFFIPIYPIAAYRIFHEEETGNPYSIPYSKIKTTYELKKVPLEWKYAWEILRVVYICLAICIGLIVIASVFSSNIFILSLCILGVGVVMISGIVYLMSDY